ncbi:hypothetical protein IE81DRAFT_29317 [Ceraceosorus guamensis]|uniref:Uncharacterized protein n=1 Tax=Ceraceosorus guamensis TaxID=1522189 RepID=A0A316W3J2_9BASI|nr:hypothetical protein IE81DRAFT_29317 [Ceraceosorus guamensis]PWN44292.1 hypothetical protein IE81DRAFT_29317 [Ceraceosorus guamensis]
MRSGTHALSILPLAFLLYAPAVKSRPLAGRAGLGIDRVDAGIERDELAAYQLDLYSKKPTKRFDPSAALSNSILLRRADDEHVVSKALKWISNKSGFGSGSKGNTSRNEHDVESQSGSGPDATTRSLQRLHISDPVIVALPTHRYGPHATEHTLSQEARPLMGYDGIPVGHPVKIRTSGMSVDQRLEHWRSKYASGRVNFGGNVNVARPPPLESQAIHAQHPEYRWTNNYYTDHMTRADHDVIFRRPQDFHPSQLSPEKFKSVAENGFLRDEVFMNRMGDGYAWDWYKHYHGVSSAPSSPSAHTPLVQPQRPALRHEGSSLHDVSA